VDVEETPETIDDQITDMNESSFDNNNESPDDSPVNDKTGDEESEN